MVTEIREAMRKTVDAASFETFPLADVVAAGSRRVRHRRIVTAVGTGGLALAVGLGALTLVGDEDRVEQPLPTELRLDDASRLDLDLVTTRVAPWEVPDDAESIAELTADGLLVQARGKISRGTFQLGLLDPATQTTDWLPIPPFEVASISSIDLGADQLVYFDWRGPREQAVLTFDRDTGSWTRAAIEVPRGSVDRLFGAVPPWLGPDDRLYLLDTGPGQHWWSVPITGGTISPEPSLEGAWAAWSGTLFAAAYADGHIIVKRDGRTVAEIAGPPDGCSSQRTVPPAQPAPPSPSFAGSRLIVSYTCGDGNLVVVYDETGQVELQTPETKGLWLGAADEEHLVFNDLRTVYLLDLETHELSAIDDTEPRESLDSSLGAGLVVWDVAVRNTDRDAWDTVHKVARLP